MAKRVLNGIALLAVAPAVVCYLVAAKLLGPNKAFPGWSHITIGQDRWADLPDDSRRVFVKGDMGGRRLVREYDVHAVDNFAAASHVDLSVTVWRPSWKQTW